MKELIPAEEARNIQRLSSLKEKFSRRWSRVCPIINENILQNAKKGESSAQVLFIAETNPSKVKENCAFAQFVRGKLEEKGYNASLIYSESLLNIVVLVKWGEEDEDLVG